MSKRPRSITILSWMFITVGLIALVAGWFPPEDVSSTQRLAEVKSQQRADHAWAFAVNALEVIGGVFMLRGCNWARWLLAAWMVFHVVLSAFHSFSEATVHVLLFSVIGYFLFRPGVSAFFRGS
jgi:hypothetical protein